MEGLMKQLLLSVILLLLLVGCTGANEASFIETAIVETQIAQPTSTETPLPTITATIPPTSTSTLTVTHTPIPISQINLEQITLMENELPSYWKPVSVSNEPPGLLDDIMTAEYTINRTFEAGEETASVTIFVYEDTLWVTGAFLRFLGITEDAGMEPELTSEVGEEGFLYVGKLYAYPVTIVGFTRCHSAVFLSLGGNDLDSLLGYAQNLDKNLQEYVCR